METNTGKEKEEVSSKTLTQVSWVTDKRINPDAPGCTKILFIVINIILTIPYIIFTNLLTYI